MLVGDTGGMFLCRKYGLSVYTDVFFNIRNSYAMEFLREEKVVNIALSIEEDICSQNDLSSLRDYKTEIFVFGRRPAMISVNCIDYNTGMCSEKINCRKHSVIENEKGDAFHIFCHDCHQYYFEDKIYDITEKRNSLNADLLRVDLSGFDDIRELLPLLKPFLTRGIF